MTETNKKLTASSFEGPPSKTAVEYAKELHSDLLKELEENVQKRIAQIISDGIKNKTGLPGMSKNIRKEFTTISKELADKVVLTETNWALSHSALDRMRKMGVDGKEWLLSNDDHICGICQTNFDQGVIPINQSFKSGHLTPPAHDGCSCAISPAHL